MSEKRKSKEFIESDSGSSDCSDADMKKKKKKEKKEKSAKKKQKCESEDDASSGWEIGRNRKVTINDFKGRQLIDIREYYTDAAGDLKPGKKGISLKKEEWEKMLSLVDKVNQVLD